MWRAGVPIQSTLTSASERPDASLVGQATHGLDVSMASNVVDFLVLDLFWLGALRPKWAMIPKTEHVTFRFNTADHVRDFVVRTVMALVVGLIAASLAAWTWRGAEWRTISEVATRKDYRVKRPSRPAWPRTFPLARTVMLLAALCSPTIPTFAPVPPNSWRGDRLGGQQIPSHDRARPR